MGSAHLLDNPVRASLTGPHAGLARSAKTVLGYPADVAPFSAMPDEPDEDSWRDLSDLTGAGGVATIVGLSTAAPQGWEVVMEIRGVQMVDSCVAPVEDPAALGLGWSDVPEMLDLVERTKPGPFLPRTIQLGSYLGIRRAGSLVAMAGERMRPPGWTEISAVCTDPGSRGQGLGTRLILALAAGIRMRDEQAFLHTRASNTNAIRLYESLGFVVRRELTIIRVRVPGSIRSTFPRSVPLQPR
jgi:ribosomal protein S18 acetylase RimI-like enzyme